jgi:hypothetical protein
MLQFDTTTVVASNPFSVNGKQFLPTIVKCAAICETGAARHRRCARALERTPWGRARSLEGVDLPLLRCKASDRSGALLRLNVRSRATGKRQAERRLSI